MNGRCAHESKFACQKKPVGCCLAFWLASPFPFPPSARPRIRNCGRKRSITKTHGSKNITEVLVDAKPGKVISVSTEAPKDQAKEKAEDQAHARN